MRRVIRLPNGKQCGLGIYVKSWRALKTYPPETMVRGFDHFGKRAADILRDLNYGLHDRINRHDPKYGIGRKWDQRWQVETRRTARDLNTPRLAIHWLPLEWRGRFGHRLSER